VAELLKPADQPGSAPAADPAGCAPADPASAPAPVGEPPAWVPLSTEGAVGAALMGLLCLITFANVVTRYLTNVSIAFTEEFSVALMVMLALVGAAAAFARNQHMRMGFLVDGLPARARQAIELLVLALGCLLFALLVWYGSRLAWDEFRFDVGSSGLGLPQWLYTIWLPVLSAVVCARIIGRMIRLVRTEPDGPTRSIAAGSANAGGKR
jgi:TRAP-type C4-dicarboxylate transport system permease small subunit